MNKTIYTDMLHKGDAIEMKNGTWLVGTKKREIKENNSK
jgi:hypothetical protein